VGQGWFWTIPSAGMPSDAVSSTTFKSHCFYDNTLSFSDFPVKERAISLQTVFQQIKIGYSFVCG